MIVRREICPMLHGTIWLSAVEHQRIHMSVDVFSPAMCREASIYLLMQKRTVPVSNHR